MNIHIWLLVLILLEYFLLCSCSVTIGKNHIENAKRNSDFFFRIVLIELIFVAALRGMTVGTDTTMYINGLNYYKGITFSEIFTKRLVYPYDWEMGYFLIVKVLAWLNINDSVFLLMIALVIYIPTLKFIKAYSKSYGLSLVMYFALSLYGYSLCLFRQMIAISICICSIQYIEKRNFFKFFLCISLAFTFHYSAICFAFLYVMMIFFDRIRKNLYAFPLIAGVFLVFGRGLINIIMKIFPSYLHYVGGKYDVSGGSYLMLLMLAAFFVLTLCYMKKEKELDFMLTLSICALLLAILTQAMSYSMTFFSRILPYYTIFLTILIPEEIKKLFFGKSKLIALLASYIIFFALFLYSLSKDSYGIIPYSFFWN